MPFTQTSYQSLSDLHKVLYELRVFIICFDNAFIHTMHVYVYLLIYYVQVEMVKFKDHF